LVYGAASRANIFKEETTDLSPSNVAGTPYKYEVSSGYFEAAGTALLAGRTFSSHDDEHAPAVAVVNRAFAANFFGSVSDSIGRYYKLQDGVRVQVVGIVEDGKYLSLTEDREPAMFLSALRSPSSESWMVVRSHRDSQDLVPAIRTKLHELDAGLPADIDSWK